MIQVADLFCGAGGTSTGMAQAAETLQRDITLTAINHWPTAVNTHSLNHPNARHLCESLDNIDPRKLFPKGLDVLVASPECTHHSNARGGKPMSDQSRATGWHVIRWAEALRPKEILVENVPEMRTWGPLGANGRPLKSKKGETFKAWVGALRSLNYRVEWKILNAADYGDATTRKRLFIRATRSNRRVQWPQQTHDSEPSLLYSQRWKPARDIIDWSIDSPSIFGRKRPLAPKTIARIEAGLKKFGGEAAEPFLVILRNNCDASSINGPLPTITAGGNHVGLAQPFLVRYNGERKGQEPRTHSVDKPMPVIDTNPRYGLCEPFIMSYYGNSMMPASVDDPLATLTTKERHALIETAHTDIRFRMLQPHELSAAMSFPEDYQFYGTKTEVVKQIGNAVPVSTAQALCTAMLENTR